MKKNKILRKFLFALVLIFLLCVNINHSIAINISNKTLNLNFKNGTLYVGGTGPNNYSKIQDAVSNSSSGDTIFVFDDSSPYIENVRIYKSISLIGENKNTTIIDGDGWGNILHVIAEGVEIRGFTITNGRCGILINTKYCFISDNIIINQIEGISIGRPLNEINGNHVKKNVYGIIIEDTNNNTIRNNLITENVGGLFILDCCDLDINSNKIETNNGGLILLESENIIIDRNKIINNNYGVYLKKSSKNIITKNNISKNNLYGIWLYNSSFNKIIINNNISKNKVGICLKNSCLKNEIFQNNFLNNSKNAYDECNNIWNDSKYGNFWSDYEEKYPDAKKKPLKAWMWDIPYEIDGGKNFDNCPLIRNWPKSRLPKFSQVSNLLQVIVSLINFKYHKRFNL
jgi:parallel beta-helix repeat protein